MSQTPRRHRNSRGEFVKFTEDQLVGSYGKENETRTLAKKSTKFGSIVALRNWQAAITPDRTQICLLSLIAITRFLSILSIISFWLCITIAVKTLPSWAGPTNTFDGYMRRRSIIAGGNQVEEYDNFWVDLFPPTESLEAYTVKISLTETGRAAAPVVLKLAIPLLLSHPLVWVSLAALSFLTRYLFSFTHGCLQRAYRATTATRQGSS